MLVVFRYRFPVCFSLFGLTVGVWSATAFGAGESGSETKTFRVMSYNIQHGRGLDGEVNLERIAAVIRKEEAGLVGLQEVDRGTRRTDRRDLTAELAELTGMTGVFRNNQHVRGGEYGNATLTKYPHRAEANTHLPMVGTREQRGVLQMVVTVGETDILFLNTHIAHRRDGEPERLASVETFARILRENAKGENLPVIFVGDFNDIPGGATINAMEKLLVDVWPLAGEGDGFTIPVREPRRRIDYVWMSRDAPFEPVRAWVPYTEASDHLPLVVEFAFR